jgi:hypothetical protein
MGGDFRGFYKVNKVLNENMQTKGDVYLVLELLLDLVESTSSNEKEGRVNVKGSMGIKLGKEKPNQPEIEPENDYEPSKKDIAGAQRDLETPSED